MKTEYNFFKEKVTEIGKGELSYKTLTFDSLYLLMMLSEEKYKAYLAEQRKNIYKDDSHG